MPARIIEHRRREGPPARVRVVEFDFDRNVFQAVERNTGRRNRGKLPSNHVLRNQQCKDVDVKKIPEIRQNGIEAFDVVMVFGDAVDE